MLTGKVIGIDVGGSHISAALVDTAHAGSKPTAANLIQINSHDSADIILAALTQSIQNIIADNQEIDAVGIAFPGPFDYENGISAVNNVGGKFEQTFGLHIRQAIKDSTGLHHLRFNFSNDAHCFAAGAYHLYKLKSQRTVFITLGTGFGSAFMLNGALITDHPDIPDSGAFYNQVFDSSIADDYFSTRWILNRYQQITGSSANSVKAIADNNSEASRRVMQELGTNLGKFLLPWLEKFNCDELVIGGNIAKALSLFISPLQQSLQHMSHKINIMKTEDTEDCIITGAAVLAGKASASNVNKEWRKSSQEILPVDLKTHPDPVYNIYPSFSSGEKVYKGFDTLAEAIATEKLVIIDGYGGLFWESFRELLHQSLLKRNKKVYWYNVNACLKPEDEIQQMIAGCLNGDDPVFGKRYSGSIEDFFDFKKLKLIQPDSSADICIIYGTGASLTGINGRLLYADVPKNEIQFRMRAGSIFNLGSQKAQENSQMYKRFYFVDWPVLNKLKARLFPKIDIIIDEQRKDEITWMMGDAFRNTLQQMLHQPFRARPWFEAGVWGGNWMKKHFPQLNQQEINYAWSFELITPENGIVIEGNQHLMEVSFDYLAYADNYKLLGKAAKRFGTEFPIRFDFLDTYNGGNLSVQCHPRPDYAKEHFGENFTQDETYYILDCEPDAVVYLGFQENIQPREFENILINAQEKGIDPDIEKYVQKLPAHKHDLFLIPNGTIHASGKNNLVLEISSTPYIFTFKMYDWMRPGLNGLPRPINIEHGMNNLYFDRKGNYVNEKLLAHPVVEKEWTGGRKIILPTHEEHFYRVDRYEFTGSVKISTNNQCHICMLVEGKKVTVSANNNSSVFHYAETFVIPAAVENYEIKNEDSGKVFVVVAQMKDEYC